MNNEIIRNLDDDLLLDLHNNIGTNLTYQRQAWLNNKESRTEHLEKLILQTRDEMKFVREQLKLRGLRRLK